ncbi:tonB-system energizer ExbB [Tardiphaga sp. vice278]|uniref:tonB-system energizer ExbB n=1 Tax=Tardiphaga sp. vice278 TaxID=2592815 RepID=UPI001164475D|nr:tonB-system energizer ExbB [Tardiphaga sp. vice278]QDM19461.1 tonB-system energizer ExbB [Tardiphaga sp. vice278]
MLLKLLSVLAVFALASPLAAQQVAAPPASAQTAPSAAPAPQAIDPSGAETAKGAKAAVAVGVHDLSPWAMFRNADIIVQLVMLGLAFASLVTWTVAIAKTMELTASQRRLKNALKHISESRSLSEAQLALGKKDTVLSVLLAAAMKEGRMSVGISSDAGIKERAASSFSEIMRAEARRIRFGMGALATIGATSPFVGLFGTVWGIMNSFIGISKSQTTNLAVVAPGIAEALLATAIGLVAAIPAVIIYNHFARVTKTYMEYVNRASGAAGRLLSRDLDRTQHSIPHSRAAE